MKTPASKGNAERGFTLIELLIAIVVGLIVVAAIITMFVGMLRANSENLKYARLNQDLRAMMTLIARDVRRAGAMQDAAGIITDLNLGNPFGSVDIAPNEQGVANACIAFSYEIETGEPERFFGFRLNSDAGTVEDFRGIVPADCSSDSGWVTLSDPSLVNVTGLEFEDPGTAVVLDQLTQREIRVILAGALRNDGNVTRSIQETVKIRNAEF